MRVRYHFPPCGHVLLDVHDFFLLDRVSKGAFFLARESFPGRGAGVHVLDLNWVEVGQLRLVEVLSLAPVDLSE